MSDGRDIVPATSQGLTPFGLPGLWTPTGWVPPDREMEFDEYEYTGSWLFTFARGLPCWIGDWLNYGERVYGETYVQAVNATGLNIGTLYNYAYVMDAIPFSRRREGLQFGHFQAIASLPEHQQDEVMEMVVENEMTVKETRAVARFMREEEPPDIVLDPPGELTTCPRCGYEWQDAKGETDE